MCALTLLLRNGHVRNRRCGLLQSQLLIEDPCQTGIDRSHGRTARKRASQDRTDRCDWQGCESCQSASAAYVHGGRPVISVILKLGLYGRVSATESYLKVAHDGRNFVVRLFCVIRRIGAVRSAVQTQKSSRTYSQTPAVTETARRSSRRRSWTAPVHSKSDIASLGGRFGNSLRTACIKPSHQGECRTVITLTNCNGGKRE